MDALINVNGENVQTLQILLLTTLITLLPSIVVMMTSFTRYIISFSFLRSALGLQQNPPNMVLVGMALFLTLFTMSPVIYEIQTTAYEPYIAEEITQEEFLQIAEQPLKEFMVRQTEPSSLALFCDLAGTETPATEEGAAQLPLRIVVPAFMTSELKHAFLIGFYLYLPFVLIDVVVASTLMSMGMIMLPPSMISMPFKLLLFIALDGWQLLFSTLGQSFQYAREVDWMHVADVLREGMGVALKLGAPLLLLSMLVGILVAIFQAVTQIHEQSLSFILKLIVVVVILLVGGGWMLETLLDFTRYLFTLM